MAAPADKQTFTYKTVGDLPIQADVYNSATGKQRPTVIWIHGGALIVGHRGGVIQRFHERLLAADWIVVSIDYRLAPETKLPAILEDVRDAYRWVQQEGPAKFGVDPELIPDYLALVGDDQDGYPGLPGWGAKSTAAVLARYTHLESIPDD